MCVSVSVCARVCLWMNVRVMVVEIYFSHNIINFVKSSLISRVLKKRKLILFSHFLRPEQEGICRRWLFISVRLITSLFALLQRYFPYATSQILSFDMKLIKIDIFYHSIRFLLSRLSGTRCNYTSNTVCIILIFFDYPIYYNQILTCAYKSFKTNYPSWDLNPGISFSE